MKSTPAVVLPVVIGACSACLWCPGCAGPLAPRESDRAPRVPPERLRTIEPMGVDRFARVGGDGEAGEADPDDAAAAARTRFEGLERVALSIAEVRAAALEHNLNLRISMINPAIAGENVRIEESVFEPVFTTRALWQENEPAVPDGFSGLRNERALVEPGVRVPLRTGGFASVSLPVGRSEGSGADSSWDSDLAFSISHPLLRDAGRSVATTGIRIAGYNAQATEAQTQLEIIAQLALVESVYWRLYQARRELEVRQQQYDLARAQLERAERLVNAGNAAEIEVVRAQSGLAERLEAIILSQNAVLAQQRTLKRVMNLPGLALDGETLVMPASDPQPVEFVLDAGALVQSALAQRMELLEVELRLLADAASIEFLRNQTLPRLDVDASWRVHGLDDDLGGSLRTLSRGRFDSWSAGAALDVPLGNEGAKARLRQGLLTRIQRLATREARELLVRQEVHDAVDRIEAGWQRILATRQAAILATRTLAAEQRQFDVGFSTSTFVLDAATRLAEAQLAEIRALVDYQLAQVELAQAVGRLMTQSRIVWAPLEQ